MSVLSQWHLADSFLPACSLVHSRSFSLVVFPIYDCVVAFIVFYVIYFFPLPFVFGIDFVAVYKNHVNIDSVYVLSIHYIDIKP